MKCQQCNKELFQRDADYAWHKWGKFLCFPCSPLNRQKQTSLPIAPPKEQDEFMAEHGLDSIPF